MSTTLTSEPNPASDGPDRPRTKIAIRVWLSVLVLAVVGSLGVFIVFAWMVNETHFDRPSQPFDELEAQLESLPGVNSVSKERWVEAPTFSNPTSWMSVTVDESGLPGLLEAACSTVYPDGITWSILVRTPAAAEVSLYAPSPAPGSAEGDGRCPDFGIDAVRFSHELDRIAPGLKIQPTALEDGRFELVVLEDGNEAGFTHLLPLVEHADDLLLAAGLEANEVVEINSASLGFELEPGEGDAYLAMLAELARSHAVSSYWADSGGTQADGIGQVQIVAPDQLHDDIEELIRTSRLHIAELPVRFLEQ